MRKCVRIVTSAFISGKPARTKNAYTDGNKLYLFKKCIAERVPETSAYADFIISDGNYPLSATTKTYLNALPGIKVYTKAGINYLNDMPWNGKPIHICALDMVA